MNSSEEELPHMLDTVMELAYERRQLIADMDRRKKDKSITWDEWCKKMEKSQAEYLEDEIVHLTKICGEEDAFLRDLARQVKKKLDQGAARAKMADEAAKKQRAAQRKIVRDARWEDKRWELERKREEEKAKKEAEVDIFGSRMEVVDRAAWALPAWEGQE